MSYTTKFIGYRAPRVAGGGMLNGYQTPKAKQDWEVGATVKVGFLTLEIVSKLQRGWRLWNAKTGQRYEFVPYEGLMSGWTAEAA